MSEDIKETMKAIRNTFSCAHATGGTISCVSKFQDDNYGKGKRLFTPINKDNKNGKRCTVCGNDA